MRKHISELNKIMPQSRRRAEKTLQIFVHKVVSKLCPQNSNETPVLRATMVRYCQNNDTLTNSKRNSIIRSVYINNNTRAQMRKAENTKENVIDTFEGICMRKKNHPP